MSIRAAFERGVAVRELTPEQHRNLYDPLFDFLRAAVTRSENEAGQSALQLEWIPLAWSPAGRHCKFSTHGHQSHLPSQLPQLCDWVQTGAEI